MERHVSFNERVDLPFRDVVDMLRTQPEAVLGAAHDAIAAVPGGAVVHMAMPMPSAPHDIDVVLGEVTAIDPHCVMIPMHWGHAEGAAWFPSIEGEIEVSDLAHASPMTQVSFIGKYRPRFGVLGTIVDAAGTHYLAEQTIQSFLTAICQHLTELATTDA